MHWAGFDFTKPRKSDLEQLNEKQRECAALQHEVEKLREHVAGLEGNLTLSLEGEEHAIAAERARIVKLLGDAESDAAGEDRGWLRHVRREFEE